jgi:6-phosphogluconolactonase/glucosamine-6-phosphate isomerase/deaminase
MESLSINFNHDISTLTQLSAEYINSLFKKYLNQKILFLTSGGSALPILDHINTDLLNHNVTVGVLDERYSTNPTINNFFQLQKTDFYYNCVSKKCEFIDTKVISGETQEKMAERFETKLKKWKKENSDGLIIATQGIGPDGHTSGIMPFPENPELFKSMFDTPEKWVVGYDAGSKNQYPLRVTTTIPFLKMIDYPVIFVTGENKRAVLQKALKNEVPVAEIPAVIIQEMKNMKVYTDLDISDNTS